MSLLNLWFFCFWGTGGALVLNRSRYSPIQRNTSALPFSSQLSAVFADGVSGEPPLFRMIVRQFESRRTLGVSPGEHVICNKQ